MRAFAPRFVFYLAHVRAFASRFPTDPNFHLRFIHLKSMLLMTDSSGVAELAETGFNDMTRDIREKQVGADGF